MQPGFVEDVAALHNLVENEDWEAVRTVLGAWHVPEIAELLFELDETDRMVIFRLLPREIARSAFAELEAEQQNMLLEELTREETRHLLASLAPDDRTYLFQELPGQVTQKLLNLLNPEDLEETRQLLGYPDESVGRVMTPDYVAVRPEWTIKRALDHLRVKGKVSETINVIYVVDNDWKLLDALDLRRFLLTDPEKAVADIMDYAFISLSAYEDREEAVRTMGRYDLSVLPVIDSTGVLVGIVTVDDVLEIASEEVTEDFHKSAAITPIRGSYREASFHRLYRKRIGWLMLLVFTNIFSGAAIAAFEQTIAAHLALMFFLPLLIGSAGNAGAQAATLMVRALAMGDVKLSDWGSLLGKEILIAGALGLTMSAAVFGLGFLRGGIDVAIVVALTMVLVVIVGSTIGTSLPFILSKFNLDPATASAPLITTLADICGVVIYFSLASWILGLPI